MLKKLRSFDVFDTVLTRTVAVPRDLFLEWEQRLAAAGLVAAGTPGRLARARMEAEREARRLTPEGEVTLAEIYDELARQSGWKREQTSHAMQIELELESASLRAVPGMGKRVAEARSEAHQILFLTDMYLPAAFIEGILRREGFFRDGDQLLVSGELKLGKHDGRMFGRVRQLFPNVMDWEHAGDNLQADVDMPQQSGIEARLETRCRLNRYEWLARGGQGETSLWRSKLAGAMRLARLENPETDGQRRVIWDTACGVVGPLLFGFVHWCLETARQRGWRRLYFVARDGQILQRIAKIIAAHWNYDVDCRYLYGSRQAWQPAAVDRFTEAEFQKFFTSKEFLPLQQVFERLGLNREDFRPQLEQFGLWPLNGETDLDAKARRRLEACLLEPAIASAIESASHARRKLLLDYLQQEGFRDGTPFALVDIGWFGNLQKSLARVLQLSGNADAPTLAGLYFALFVKDNAASTQNMSDYWHAFASRNHVWRKQYLALLEIFTAADHGSVVGFERKDHRILPQLAGERNTRALDWGLPTLQAAILRFAELFSQTVERNLFVPAEFFPVSHRLLNEFYLRPSQSEAAVWGSFQYSEGQTESSFEQLIPKWSRWQTLAALLYLRQRPSLWWQEGSRASSPSPSLSLFLTLKRLKERLKG